MVNKNSHPQTTTREQILFHLTRSNGQPLSGQWLADATGISRVAVWKHIKRLCAEGAKIQSSPTGYVLETPEDLLFATGFPDDLRALIIYDPEVTSTMNRAKELAREGAPHMSCCVAERQTSSRGRLNRQWFSPEGGLWFSLILRPDLPPHLAYTYNFAASITLSRVLNRLFDLAVKVKWPNDLLLEDQKLAGLLSEMETEADMVRFLVVGIGLNVNNDPSDSPFNATSLSNVLGRKLPRQTILTEFLREFSTVIRNMEIPGLMAQWKKMTCTIGRRVRVETHKSILEGEALDIAESGALILKTDSGETRQIIYGDCFHT